MKQEKLPWGINSQLLVLLGFVFIYLVTHLPSLTELPVFADESIYIRWAQLIIDDWKRYLFFPMNDGKTPFFIWTIVPFQFVFKDQLFAGRFVSLLVGLVQVFMNMKIVRELGGRKNTQILAGVLTTILPFWYFHQRMALMDGMLTLFISIAFLMLTRISKRQTKKVFDRNDLKNILVAGVSFGLAMLTKIPAVLFLPAFYLSIFLGSKKDFETLFKSALKVSLAVLIGLLMFGSLKIHPVFGQLFSRGGDFLFPLSEILTGTWKQTLPSIPNYINYFFMYLTPGIIVLIIASLFSKKNKVVSHVLFWSGVFFILPIVLMGKTVYPRYLFPASLFFTLSAVMGLESLIAQAFNKKNNLWKKTSISVILALLVSNILTSSLNYIQLSIFNTDSTPFVSSDSVQYLQEWSSGHGIKETVELIETELQVGTVAVATEGYFGTLPDGLLMYLHRKDLSNLYLEGVGYPISGVPKSFADRAINFDKKWLVVNSHRMNLKIDEKYLLDEFCRPGVLDSEEEIPCLQVWDITKNFEVYIKD